MDGQEPDPATVPLSAIDTGFESPSPSRVPSLGPSAHDDPSTRNDPSEHDDVSDSEREDDKHSDVEDEASDREDEVGQNEKGTPRVVDAGEEQQIVDFNASITSAAKVPLNDSEQTDYSELSDSSEVEDNVSLSGAHSGYDSEHEADHDTIEEHERDYEKEDEHEQEQQKEDEDCEAEEEEPEEFETTVALQTNTPQRSNKRPLPRSGPRSSRGPTPAKAHFSDAFITPHPKSRHLSIGTTPAASSLLNSPPRESQIPEMGDSPEVHMDNSAPSSIKKLTALQSALAEKEKRIRHLEDMLAGDGPSEYTTFTPEKRLKTTYTDSPGSRPRVQHTPQPSVAQPSVKSTPVPERVSVAPSPIHPRSPIRLLANIFEDMSHGIEIPSPPSKEERKADKRRRMTREFRDFSAQGLPSLKKRSPQVAAVVEEEEEEQSVEEKPKDIESLEASKSILKEDVSRDQGEAAIEETEHPTEPATEPTTESAVEEIIKAPKETPIASTVFDPRKCRATSAPIDGHGSKHSEDESFPDVNFFRRDYHTIEALQTRIEELETELSNATIALKIATSALTAERRARLDAEETRRFMEVERQVGACCHAQEELDKLQSQLQLQQDQEGRKLEEVSKKLVLEREERAHEREQWAQEKARMERQHARHLERAIESKKRPATTTAAPAKTGGSSRPASSTSFYEAPSRKVMQPQQRQEDGPVRALRKRLADEVPATTATTASSRARLGTASSQSKSTATAPTTSTREKKVLNPAAGNVLLNSQGGQAMRKGVLGPKGGGGIEKVGGPIRTIRKVDTSAGGRMARR